MTDTEPRTEAQPAEGHTWEGRHDRAEDQQPDSGERHAADRFLAKQDPEDAERVAEHHEEMRKIGANVKGEGEIN